MYVEEPWKGSVPEVHHKRTTDGSDLRVIDPNSNCGFLLIHTNEFYHH